VKVLGFVVLAGMGTVYLLLSMGSAGLLAGFGYLFAALLYVLSILNLVKTRK